MRRLSDAGWSSLAARRAHNPKVAGSNPAPATNYDERQLIEIKGLIGNPTRPFFFSHGKKAQRQRRMPGMRIAAENRFVMVRGALNG